MYGFIIFMNLQPFVGPFLLFFSWGETELTWYCGHYWPIIPAPWTLAAFSGS
jgi:hypothetical protein